MGKIKIVSSMVLDAICFIDQYNCLDSDSNLLEEQMNFIEKIESLCPEKLKNGSLSMSALSMALTAYAEGDDFENYTLDDLAKFFKNAEQVRDVVKSKEMSEFLASHIHPILDGLIDEWAEKYLGYINIFKEINFDKLWESDFLPIIQEEINKNETIAQNINIDEMFADMEKLKQCEPFGDVKIYISPMSFPVSFKLYGNSFLQAARTNLSAGLIAHELMHGFMDEKLEKLYLDYINSIKYLREQHNRLINEQRSGNEEEFVMAAEYYLRMKYNNEDRKELLKYARNNYGGCVPTSVFLFDLLSKEEETPKDYVAWLTDVFENKKLPKKAIERNLDIVCPKEPIEIFNDNLFGSFRRVIDKMKELQSIKNFDILYIEKKIESLVNHNFKQVERKEVYFGQEYQPLPNALKIKELCVDNLFINIAEYKDRETALCDGINDAGGHIGAEMEKVNGKWRHLYNVNISCVGKTPTTLSATFVKNNHRISFTAKCPDYVCRNIDYPSTLKELNDAIMANIKSLHETGQPTEFGKSIPDVQDFCVKYSQEILATQKQIEEIIMKL